MSPREFLGCPRDVPRGVLFGGGIGGGTGGVLQVASGCPGGVLGISVLGVAQKCFRCPRDALEMSRHPEGSPRIPLGLPEGSPRTPRMPLTPLGLIWHRRVQPYDTLKTPLGHP